MKFISLNICLYFTLFVHAMGYLTNLEARSDLTSHEQTIFMGIHVRDYDQTLPLFLRSIENLDYEKKLLTLQFDLYEKSPVAERLVSEWISKKGTEYKKASIKNHTRQFSAFQEMTTVRGIFAEIKDNYLREGILSKCSHILILSSENFLTPKTLKILLIQNKPIIAPLLRPVPKAYDPYRNFFGDINELGYYKDSPDYLQIANREKIGTFKVPLVQGVYLIQSEVADRLSFSEGFIDWEFLAFSNHARKNGVDQYICNEKEFGFLLHIDGENDKKKREQFSLVGAELEMSPLLLDAIFLPFYADDPIFHAYVKRLDFSEYSFYRVENRDLFFIDEVNDYIKNYVLKRGGSWEEYIHEQFKKYVRPGSVALDIGGHIGTHTLNLSRLVEKNGRVHVFEPQAKMFCELAINMHLNGCENIHYHRNALGREEKMVAMYIPQEDWTARFGPTLINEGHGTVAEKTLASKDQAKMIRLDDLHLNNISLIKMDVEGYEMEVISGGKETILSNKPVMIIEIFHDQNTMERIKEIESLGYTYKPLGCDNYLFLPHSKEDHHDFSEIVKYDHPIKIAWEGSFFDLGSLSHVNRAFTEKFAQNPQVDITCVTNTMIKAKQVLLIELTNYASKIRSESSEDTQVTIRHSWPPNWEAPKGKWVLIQPWEFGSLPLEWVEKCEKVDEFWVPTEYVKRVYVESGIPYNKIHIVPNGINPDLFHPQVKPYPLSSNKKYKFLFIGGTIFRKGFDILLNSYLNAFTSLDNVSLIVKDFGGKGPYKGQTNEKLIREAQGKSGSPEILYLDQDMTGEEIASLYTACDCLVYPYRGEGFALPVLEAMASGLPVLVTVGGATDDFVTSAFGWFIPATKKYLGGYVENIQLVKEGWLLDPNAEVLSEQMRWLVDHPEEGRIKGHAGSEHVRKNWTWERASARAFDRLKALVSPSDNRTGKKISE